jgi:predicted Fe-Mo cluster-binding NifX family protein
MIAVPVKTNKENPVVSTLFGKAKWFAFIDDGKVTIEANNTESGRVVVEELVKRGVKQLVFHHMGGNPYMLLQRAGIECFHDGGKRIFLDEVLKKLQKGELNKVDVHNMNNFIEQGKMHNNDKEHQHHHEHDHHH